MGMIGGLAWIAIFSSMEKIQEIDAPVLYWLSSGYSLGFLAAFSGTLFKHLVTGEIGRFVDDHPATKWISCVLLALILLIGLASLVAEVFGTTNWSYNLGAVVGATVFALGLWPAIEYWDSA